jgi:hypothetical protein
MMAKKVAALFDGPEPETSTSKTEAATSKTEMAKPAYREGKKAIATWINEKAVRQLKIIAAENDTTVQDLFVDMINREFARRGRPEIA